MTANQHQEEEEEEEEEEGSAMSSTPGTGPLKYQALTEPDSFRLLLIQPSQSAIAPIECSLVHSTLSLCDREIIDHYTALSYVWGDASQTAQIIVDGYLTTITATLESAIRSLRDETRVFRLWADALCIDQSNMNERAQQVRQMGSIYTNAQHTVIYLGSPTPSLETLLLHSSSSITSSLRSSPLSEHEILYIAEHHLLTLPWFRRVWVFQELLLSRDPWLQSGRTRTRWTYFCNNVLQLFSSTSKNSKRPGLKVLTDMHFAREKRTQTDLYNILLARCGFGATDARDMIFAHLGIAKDRKEWEGRITVRYEQSCESLYEDVAEYLFEGTGPRTVMCLAGNGTTKMKGLASWAPDWGRAVVLLEDMHQGSYRDHMMTIAPLRAAMHYKFLKNPRLLAYVGYQVDVVSAVSLGISESTQHDAVHRTDYQKTVEDLRALYGRAGGSYTSGDKDGRYVHINLRGKEAEHEELCLRLRDEWVNLIRDELPVLSPLATAEELASHKRFNEIFSSWLTERAKQGVIAVPPDVQGIEGMLYTHLHPNTPPSVFNGRRLACMASGRVGVVPLQARQGDIVVFLAGIPMPFVLRSLGGDEESSGKNLEERIFTEIKDQILTAARDGSIVKLEPGNKYHLSYMHLFKSGNEGTKHAKVVGEAFVEGVIGWLLKECDEMKEFGVFALH